MKYFLLLASLLVVLGVQSLERSAASVVPRFIIIGTGGVTGVYHPLGGAICRAVNLHRKQHGMRCSLQSTQGSLANLDKLDSRKIDLAIVQSDILRALKKASTDPQFDSNSRPKYTNLRSVVTLHQEAFTIVARADAGIKSLSDLVGKRINIGRSGSGHRYTMNQVMKANGWSDKDFASVSNLGPLRRSKALCNNKIDAYVVVIGHPAGSIKNAVNNCAVRLVEIKDEDAARLFAAEPHYQPITIPGGMYRGNKFDTSTFGVSAVLVASATTPDDLVYLIVKDLVESLPEMTKIHAAFTELSKNSFAVSESSLLMHGGAARYFANPKPNR